jgi:hypothetical protein
VNHCFAATGSHHRGVDVAVIVERRDCFLVNAVWKVHRCRTGCLGNISARFHSVEHCFEDWNFPSGPSAINHGRDDIPVLVPRQATFASLVA